MTLHMSARQWGRQGPQGVPAGKAWYCNTCGCENPPGESTCRTIGCPGKPKLATRAPGHRTDGYQRKRAAWVCIQCRAWHDAKPKVCIAPDCDNAVAGKELRFLFFDSKGEGLRFMQLWAQQDQGHIRAGTLQHHPRFELCAPCPRGGPPVPVAVYEADSAYVLHTGETVVEDFKPKNVEALDPMFKLKRRWFEAQYAPLRITLVHT